MWNIMIIFAFSISNKINFIIHIKTMYSYTIDVDYKELKRIFTGYTNFTVDDVSDYNADTTRGFFPSINFNIVLT